MAVTDQLRRQHREIAEASSEIRRLLQPTSLANDASEVRTLVSQLMGKLTVHLSMEDRALYPSLVASGDASVAGPAQRFMDEMSHIGESIEAYRGKWPHAESIQADPTSFMTDTGELLDSLAERVQREERDLFPLADQLMGG